MPIYWSLKQIPELAGLSAEERSVAWRRASMKTFRHWQTWVALVACGLCGAAGSMVGGHLGSSLLGAAVGGGIGGFLFGQVATSIARKHYRELLQGKGP